MIVHAHTLVKRGGLRFDAGGRSSPPGAPPSLPPAPSDPSVAGAGCSIGSSPPPRSPACSRFAGGAELDAQNKTIETPLRPARVGYERVNTDGRRRSTTGDVPDVIERSEQRGCWMCARVCCLAGGAEVEERGESGACLCLLLRPASPSDHRLGFTCVNDLAIVTDIFLTRFLWRINLWLFPWGLQLVPSGLKIFQDKR